MRMRLEIYPPKGGTVVEEDSKEVRAPHASAVKLGRGRRG